MILIITRPDKRTVLSDKLQLVAELRDLLRAWPPDFLTFGVLQLPTN